jgi:hypothetical protein
MKTKTQRTAKKPSPARVHTQEKRAKQIRYWWCCGAACSEPAEAQLAVVVGKNRVLVATTRVDRERRRRSTARVRQCGYVFR